jgi:small subunit ribosomal protein S4
MIRRFMIPLKKKKNSLNFNYKSTFYTKQKLKKFYGKLDEYKFRMLFKLAYNKMKSDKMNSFYGALEQRLDIVLFRMKLLPTIFACNQLVQHHGIMVNNSLITLPNYRIQVGDIVSVPNKI